MNAHAPATLDVANAWRRLGAVLDPEVPVLSVVELGIVRDVAIDAGRLRVTITPTYSGCPAIEAIVADIRAALGSGAGDVDVVTVLAPAWTTDWIAPEARTRLRDYGIVPPHTLAATQRPVDVTGISPLRRHTQAIACPRCGSHDTALLAQFGSTACKALYRCGACAEPFDYMKPH